MPAEFRDQERASFARKPRFAGKPGEFSRAGAKPGGFNKSGGFKKKYVGKAAGAKGAYKGGKAFRDKQR